MATEYSFDVVSKVDMQEVRNAVDQARREIETRFDFKGSQSTIELDEKTATFTLASDNEARMQSLVDVLQSKLHRRGVDLRALELGEPEEAAKGTLRRTATLRQGLDADTARKIVKMVKDRGLKVQAQMQGEQVRVSGKAKDDLQSVLQYLKSQDAGVPLQFINYR